jgi:hypothetical protein
MVKGRRCQFCDEGAVFVVPDMRLEGKPAACCRRCGNLAAAGNWKRLAYRWLVRRPQDWVEDVSSYLEAHAARPTD